LIDPLEKEYRAAEVSSPPEKAMPTFWPTGSDSRITDMLENLS
jgi:hypothetical protein